VAPSAERVVKCHTVMALQTQCTFVHVVANVANTIKEGVDNVLLVHGHVQRRRSSEDAVLVDHELCETGTASLHGAAPPRSVREG
jgi:hypothetical protein